MSRTQTRTLIVLPDDGIRPVLAPIAAAKKSILVKMFLFSETRLVRALIAAHKRGVKVRVMLNPARRSGKSENREARRKLKAGGILARDTHPEFDVSHEKSMVIDGEIAFVKSHNWAPKNFGGTRDYAVITRDPAEVAEVMEGFEADWKREKFDPEERLLIWCRGNGRARIARFIDGAKKELLLQNERYQDPTIVERQVARTADRVAARDPRLCATAMATVETVARDGGNVMPSLIDAVRVGATLGELADVFRSVFGEFREPHPW